MIKELFGKDNKTLKFIRSLKDKKGRKAGGCFLLEGERAVYDSLRINKESIKYIVVSENYRKDKEEVLDKISETVECLCVPDRIFSSLSATESPSGIIAAAIIPENNISDFSYVGDVLILDSVSDPGNMGTIIRTAEAMGFFNIFLFGNCVDIYSPKVVRSTMGSIIRTHFYKTDSEGLEKLKKEGYTLFSTALTESSISPDDAEYTEKNGVIIGNEANGISDKALNLSDKFIKIPMEGEIESLNAAVAAAVVMYSFSSKRRKGGA